MSNNINNEKNDFPFYNGNPSLSAADWIILLIGIIAVISMVFIPVVHNPNVASVLFCLFPLIPILYVCRGKLNLLFKKIKARDLPLIIACLILFFIYEMLMAYILTQLGVTTYENTAVSSNMDVISWICLFMQLLGEELFRITILLLTMTFVYRFTDNRKLSLVCGIILSLIVFGLAHYNSYNGAILQMILMISVGSLFYTLAYLKTKNVFVSYITHILIDSIPLVGMMLFP